MDIYPIILSGGAGTRLWPLSREAFPKQFLRLTSGHSLLRETVLRLRGLDHLRAPIVVANHEHRFFVAEHLRAIEVVPHTLFLEPVSRNTAPALAVAALCVVRENPDGLVLVLPLDHHISDAEAFRRSVRQAAPLGARNLVRSASCRAGRRSVTATSKGARRSMAKRNASGSRASSRSRTRKTRRASPHRGDITGTAACSCCTHAPTSKSWAVCRR